MAANAAFTSVTGVVASVCPLTGVKTVVGTAVGPNVAGADTVIDLSSYFASSVIDCKMTLPGTAWYACTYAPATNGAPATGKMRIFTGTTDVAQSTADLSAITATWVAWGYDN